MSVSEQRERIPQGISLDDAVHAATHYLETILKTQPANLRLEEVERDREEGVWRITLGYDGDEHSVPLPERNSLNSLLYASKTKREYKIISLDNTSGEFLSMKIRAI